MQIFFSIFLALVLALGVSDGARAAERPTVGVPAASGEAIASDELTSVRLDTSDLVFSELTRLGRFRVLERTRMKALADELYLSMTGLTEDSPEMGRLLGAKYLALTQVTSLTAREESGTVAGSYKVRAVVTLRLVETETGEVVAAAIGEGKARASRSGVLDSLRISDVSLVREEAMKAVEKAVRDAMRGSRGLDRALKARGI